MSQVYQHGNEATTKKPFKFNKPCIFFWKNFTIIHFHCILIVLKTFHVSKKLSCDCLQQFQVTCLGTVLYITHSDLRYKTVCYWQIIKRNIYFLSKNSIVLVTNVDYKLFMT